MKLKKTYLLLTLISIASFAPLLWKGNIPFTNDWDSYFEPMSLFIRSAFWSYGKLPIYNPWRCGGSDFLTNPQSRIASPLVLLDLLFHPQWANILTLVVWSIAGTIGMFLLLQFLGVTYVTAIVGATLFTTSGWLSLHFAEGHITYSLMQLLPLVFWLGLQWRSKRIQFLIMAVFATIFLEGAIQPLIYGGLILACAILMTYQSGMGTSARKLDIKYVAWLGLIFILITSLKILPVYLTLHSREPTLDLTILPISVAFQAFLNPFQKLGMPVMEGLSLSFHEFGCYLGWIALALFLKLLLSKSSRKENAWFFGFFFFWLWTGTGWGAPLNPWLVFEKIPVLNQAHLQSRLFILLYVFFIILVSRALDTLRKSKAIWVLAALLLLLENHFVRFRILNSVGTTPGARNDGLMVSTTLEETVTNGWETKHFLTPNRGATGCNERNKVGFETRPKGHPEYKGEIFFSEGKGTANFQFVLPNSIGVNYDVTEPSIISMNLNNFWGWDAEPSHVKVISKGISSRIHLQVPPGKGTAILRYAPKYLFPSLVLFLIGSVLFMRKAWLLHVINRINLDTYK